MTYTADELRAMPTIRSGLAYDLKIDTGRVRVWVRRDDGQPAIIVQLLENGGWETIGAFRERLSAACQWLVDRRDG